MHSDDCGQPSPTHPCFSRSSACTCGRIHLPVAKDCSISCVYCDRKYDCVNEARPGVTSRLLTPLEACQSIAIARARYPTLTVAGIAGPGDPLANPTETLETFRLVHAAYPDLHLCLSTNGLALPAYRDALRACGVRYITVTVNAVDPLIGRHIYRWVKDQGTVVRGADAACLLLERQKAGILGLRDEGFFVKINTVVLPANAAHIPAIAKEVATWGVHRMNCIPVLPLPSNPLPAPTAQELEQLRSAAAAYVPQIRHCARCRADAVGPLASSVPLATLAEASAS